jgi:aspartate-semialdehyde dehydrogenase
MSKTKIAVVGGSGLVGSKMLQVLKERNVGAEIFLFNSKVPPTDEICEKMRFDYALMAVSAELAAQYTPLFVKYGTMVIDNSSYYRMKKNVPLVVPEINFNDVGNSKIIANPNCSTIGCVLPLYPLDKVYKIKRVVYSTYQAISGAGANPKFLYPSENNLFPHIDEILENGNTKEEEKMINETKKILHKPDIAVSATCVRVPVANCHCAAVNCEFEKTPKIAEVKKILAKAKGVILCDIPMPVTANERDEVFVGRIRLDKDNKNTINFWTCSDNVRKGAATNAVQILEMLMQVKREQVQKEESAAASGSVKDGRAGTKYGKIRGEQNA